MGVYETCESRILEAAQCKAMISTSTLLTRRTGDLLHVPWWVQGAGCGMYTALGENH